MRIQTRYRKSPEVQWKDWETIDPPSYHTVRGWREIAAINGVVDVVGYDDHDQFKITLPEGGQIEYRLAEDPQNYTPLPCAAHGIDRCCECQ